MGCRRGLHSFLLTGLTVLAALSSRPASGDERPLRTSYDEGVRLETVGSDAFRLVLGAVLQADYRHYGEDERADDRFDIRRARLSVAGGIGAHLRYRFEYEFQGNETQNLTDAYGELTTGAPWALIRVGQFKVPFGLEWQTRDRDLPFAERSTAVDLGPGRDVGLMVHGGVGDELLHYGLGVFNGDGRDGSTRGNQEDGPEVVGRVVFAPLAPLAGAAGDLRVGLAGTFGRIDLSDVDLEVKSVGMVGTGRNLYVLNRNSKFGVLQDADSRYRVGLEAAWALGSAALFGEYVHLRYTGLKPVGQAARDADFRSWYVAGLWALAAEPVSLHGAVLQPFRPKRTAGNGGWGALVLAARLGRFEGDGDWIVEDAHVSVEEATAYTAAVAWIPRPEIRVSVDYTASDFSDRLRVRVNPDGSVDYVDQERVLTTRFQLTF